MYVCATVPTERSKDTPWEFVFSFCHRIKFRLSGLTLDTFTYRAILLALAGLFFFVCVSGEWAFFFLFLGVAVRVGNEVWKAANALVTFPVAPWLLGSKGLPWENLASSRAISG